MERRNKVIIAVGGIVLSFAGIFLCFGTGLCHPFWGGLIPLAVAEIVIILCGGKKPSICRNCGSDKFKFAPNAELIELHQALTSYYSADMSGVPNVYYLPPPLVCTACGEPR